MNAKSRPEQQKLVQVVHNFFSKTAQIIAQGRLVPVPEPSGKVNKWFNLEIDELERIRDDLRPWRQPPQPQLATELSPSDRTAAVQSLSLPPLVIEVVVDPRDLVQGQALVLRDKKGRGWNCAADTAGPGASPAAAASLPREVVLERWVVELLPDEVADADAELPVVYKRAIIAMRALYTLVRLMPSWQLRQRLVRQKFATVPLRMGVRVFSGNRPISSRGRIGLSRPIVPEPAQDVLKNYQLSPVDTPAGTLAVSVSYRANVAFDVEDAEKVLAQQFLDFDSSTTRPHNPSAAAAAAVHAQSYAGSHTAALQASLAAQEFGGISGSASASASASVAGSAPSGSHFSSNSRRPTFSFTRPFRNPDQSTTSLAGSAASVAASTASAVGSVPPSLPNSSSAPVSQDQHGPGPVPHTVPHSSFARTPSQSSLSRTAPQSVPVPVPWRSQSPMVQANTSPSGLTSNINTANTTTATLGTPASTHAVGVVPPGSASSSYSRRFSSSFASRHSAFVPRSSESRVLRPSSIHSGSASASVASTSASVAGSLEPGSGLYVAHEDAGDFVRFVDDAQRRASAAFRGPRASHPTSVDTSLQRYQNLRTSHSQLSDSMFSASTTMRPSPSRASDSPPADVRSSRVPHPSSGAGVGAGGNANAGSGSAGANSGSDKSTLRRRSSGRTRLSFYGGPSDDSHEVDADHESDSRDDHELLFAMSDMHE